MVSNDAVTKILRKLKFRYKTTTDRMVVWKQAGSTKRVLVRRNQGHDEDYVRVLLRQAGMNPTEIESFIAGTKQ
jgi:hypothetical protein